MRRYCNPVGLVAVMLFVASAAVRLPSCGQSFWVDELHSAWTVWDGWNEVGPRAKAGNQSPVYFLGLWFWRQVFGGGEVMLRLSSVLATSLAAVVLTVGTARWTKNVVAGAAAGLVMAFESNAIFFGTELRPYAVVILCGSITAVCFVNLLQGDGPAWAWTLMLVSVWVAMVVQPTSILILAMPPMLLGIRSAKRLTRTPHLARSSLLIMAAFAVTAVALWNATLEASWQVRGNWASFAVARHPAQILSMWPWAWLWGLPMLIGCFCRRRRGEVMLLGILCVSVTGCFWVVSWMDWVHLWHRRYMVVLLPMFAMLVGGATGVVTGPMRAKFPRSSAGFPCCFAGFPCCSAGLAPCIAIGLIGGLLWSQGTARAFLSATHQVASRNEDWRGAVAWVSSSRLEHDAILLDPGLIESRHLDRTKPDEARPPTSQLRYLAYPLSGPYQLDPVRVIPPIGTLRRADSDRLDGVCVGSDRAGSDTVNPAHRWSFNQHRTWIIARASGSAARRFVAQLDRRNQRRAGDQTGRGDAANPQVRSFGGVSVITLPGWTDQSR